MFLKDVKKEWADGSNISIRKFSPPVNCSVERVAKGAREKDRGFRYNFKI
jgi:hypothetical protein